MSDRIKPIPTTQGFLNPSLVFSKENGQDCSAGTPVDLINETLTSVVYLMNCLGSCSMSGVFKVFADSSLIGEMRTGPGCPNASFGWSPHRRIDSGVVLKIQFTLNNSKAAARAFASINGIKE